MLLLAGLAGLAGLATGLGRHSGLGASELCEVSGATKLGEGYSVVDSRQCNQFCVMTRGCRYWTWYHRVTEEGAKTAQGFWVRSDILLRSSSQL